MILKADVLYKRHIEDVCENLKEEQFLFSANSTDNLEVYDTLKKIVESWGEGFVFFGYERLIKYI